MYYYKLPNYVCAVVSSMSSSPAASRSTRVLGYHHYQPVASIYRLAQLRCIIFTLRYQMSKSQYSFATGDMSYINPFPIAYILDHRLSLIAYGSSKSQNSGLRQSHSWAQVLRQVYSFANACPTSNSFITAAQLIQN